MDSVYSSRSLESTMRIKFFEGKTMETAINEILQLTVDKKSEILREEICQNYVQLASQNLTNIVNTIIYNHHSPIEFSGNTVWHRLFIEQNVSEIAGEQLWEIFKSLDQNTQDFLTKKWSKRISKWNSDFSSEKKYDPFITESIYYGKSADETFNYFVEKYGRHQKAIENEIRNRYDDLAVRSLFDEIGNLIDDAIKRRKIKELEEYAKQEDYLFENSLDLWLHTKTEQKSTRYIYRLFRYLSGNKKQQLVKKIFSNLRKELINLASDASNEFSEISVGMSNCVPIARKQTNLESIITRKLLEGKNQSATTKEVQQHFPGNNSQVLLNEIARLYGKIASEKLRNVFFATVDKRFRDRDIRFFDKCRQIKKSNYNDIESFWCEILFEQSLDSSLTGTHYWLIFVSLEEDTKKRLLSNWIKHINRQISLFSPMEKEQALMNAIQELFSSSHLPQSDALKWENLFLKSTDSIVSLKALREINWDSTNYKEFFGFKKSLDQISYPSFTKETASQMYNYLEHIFTLTVEEKHDTFGTVVIVSKRVMYINKQEIDLSVYARKENVYEIRVYASKLMVLECNLEKNDFHGKNLVFVGNKMVISKKREINVSGNGYKIDLKPINENERAKDGQPGANGNDGKAGESSGNIFIFMEQIIYPENLTLKMCGGNGEGGQNGSPGGNGIIGKGTSVKELEEELYPKYKSLWRKRSKKLLNYEPEHEFVRKPGGTNMHDGSNPWVHAIFEHEDGRRLEWSYAGDNGKIYNIYDVYMIVRGAKGLEPGLGGESGLGGEEGNFGELTITINSSEKDAKKIKVIQERGIAGKHGVKGKPGAAGRDGNDVAIIDRSSGNKNQKFTFGGENHNLTIEKYLIDGDKTRLNGYYRSMKDEYFYITFKENDITDKIAKDTRKDRGVTDRQKQSRAKNKQSISRESALQMYEELFADNFTFISSEINVIVEEISEERVFEQYLCNEICIKRSALDDAKIHNENAQRKLTKPEEVLEKIYAANGQKLTFNKRVELYQQLLTVPLNMEEVQVYFPNFWENFVLDFRKEDFSGKNDLLASLNYKISLSYYNRSTQSESVTFTLNNQIKRRDYELIETSIAPLDSDIKKYQSEDYRDKFLVKIKKNWIKHGGDKLIFIALYNVHKYLSTEHGNAFKQYEKEIDWTDHNEVLNHLKEFVDPDDKKIIEKEIDAFAVVETLEELQDEDNQTAEADSGLISRGKALFKEGKSYFYGQTSAKLEAIKNIVDNKETKKACSELCKLVEDRDSLKDKFILEKSKLSGTSYQPGSTPLSLIHIYFLSKKMLEVWQKIYRAFWRYKEYQIMPVNWVSNESDPISFESMRELFKNAKENEQPGEDFFSHLHRDKLNSSAYRLLVSIYENINLNIYSDVGYSKYRLIETNNSSKTSKSKDIILHYSKRIYSPSPNKVLQELKNEIVQLSKSTFTLQFSSSSNLQPFVDLQMKKEIEEWSTCLMVATGSDKFLCFIRRLFEVRGCACSRYEILFLMNSIIDAVCNYEIPLDQIYHWILGEHGNLIEFTLPLRVMSAIKNNSLSYNELKNGLQSIQDSSLRVLFGTKLQEGSLAVEDLKSLINMLSNSQNCFTNLEHSSLKEWIDTAKMQSWTDHEPTMQKYGKLGYFLVLLYSSGKYEEKNQLEQLMVELSESGYTFFLEKFIARLTYGLINHEIKLAQKSLEILLKSCSQEINTCKTAKERFEVICDEKMQQICLAEVSKKKKKDWDNLFPSNERTLDELISLCNASHKEEQNQLKLIQMIEHILTEVDSSDRAIEIRTFFTKINSVLKKLTEKKDESGNIIKEGIVLRLTQKIAILSSFLHERNLLAQVNTGEGKSYIIATLAVMKATMSKEKVDIITSNSVLAQRDSQDMEAFYKEFELTVSNNCSPQLEERQNAYKCDIVYGDISSFEQDYLLSYYYKKNILGARERQAVIVDEVDSMLLDQGNTMLYLSHHVPGMELLEGLFVFMHKQVYTRSFEGKKNESITAELKKAVLADLCGLLTKQDLEMTIEEADKPRIDLIWALLQRNKLLGEDGRLLPVPADNKKQFFEEMEKKNLKSGKRILRIIATIEKRSREIRVPKYLKEFILSHLDEFVDNAYKGLFLKEGKDYVVDLSKSRKINDLHPNVIIIDQGTGTDLATSHWNGGLHQFVQLKHGCRLAPFSSKSVFISNVSYLKEYKKIHGFSGTLGSNEESSSLKKLYDADVIRIPTWKPKNFNEYAPILAEDPKQWLSEIFNQICNQFDAGRSVLLICPSINDVRSIKEQLDQQAMMHRSDMVELFKAAIQYKREDDEIDFDSGLKPQQLVIATNLAGRGTDIKLTDELVNNGGIHVILASQSENTRIEDQAYGRAARCGQPGSGQMITQISGNGARNIFQLKQFRDNGEVQRLRSLKTFYDFSIAVEEDCLKLFANHCKDALKEMYNDSDDSSLPSLQKIIYFALLDKWALWLDSQMERIRHCKRSANEGERQEIFQLVDKFLKEHPIEKRDNSLELLESLNWIKAPQPLINAALVLISEGTLYPGEEQTKEQVEIAQKKINEAEKILTRIEKEFPDFIAEAAYYKGVLYQIGAKQFKIFSQKRGMFDGFTKNWLRPIGYIADAATNTVKTGVQHVVGLENADDEFADHIEEKLEKAMASFTLSRSDFMRRIKTYKMWSSVIMNFRQVTKDAYLSEGYLHQQEENIALCETAIGNIDDIIGNTVSYSDFVLETDKAFECFRRKRDYQYGGLITPVVLASKLTKEKLHHVALENALPPKILFDWLNAIPGEMPEVRVRHLANLPMPSLSHFWDTLRAGNYFAHEEVFIGLKKSISIVISFLKDTEVIQLQAANYKIRMSQKEMDEFIYYVMPKKMTDDQKILLQAAMEAGEAYIERCATLNAEAVKNYNKPLRAFDFITEDTIRYELDVELEEFEWIIKKLLDRKILKVNYIAAVNEVDYYEKEKQKYPGRKAELLKPENKGIAPKMFAKGFILDENRLDFSIFPEALRPSLELVFNRHFIYGYQLKTIREALIEAEKNNNPSEMFKMKLFLPTDPIKNLYNDLISYGILEESRVTEVLNVIYKKEINEELMDKITDILPSPASKVTRKKKSTSGIPLEIYERLEKKTPLIKENDCKLIKTLDYFREKCVNSGPDTRKLFINNMRQLASIEKPNKWRKWAWHFGLFAVAAAILAPIAVIFMPVAYLVVGIIISATVGSLLYAVSLVANNRKAFSNFKHETHEEFTRIISNHDIAVKQREIDFKCMDIAEDYKKFADWLRGKLKLHVLSHCHVFDFQMDVSEAEIKEAVKEQLKIPGFKLIMESHIKTEARKLIEEFEKQKTNGKSDFNSDMEILLKTIHELPYQHSLVLAGEAILKDIEKNLERENILIKLFIPEEVKEEEQVREIKKIGELPETENIFVLIFQEELENIFDEIFDTQVVELIHKNSAEKRHNLQTNNGSLAPDDAFVQEKSSKYSSECLSLTENSTFMRKDLNNILLKMCFYKIRPEVISHMVTYNFGLSTHCARIVFKGVVSLISSKITNKLNEAAVQLTRNGDSTEIYSYTLKKGSTQQSGKILLISLELHENCFYISRAEKNSTRRDTKSVYDELATGLDEFSQYYSIDNSNFQKDLANEILKLDDKEQWKETEKWHGNEKLLSPIHVHSS